MQTKSRRFLKVRQASSEPVSSTTALTSPSPDEPAPTPSTSSTSSSVSRSISAAALAATAATSTSNTVISTSSTLSATTTSSSTTSTTTTSSESSSSSVTSSTRSESSSARSSTSKSTSTSSPSASSVSSSDNAAPIPVTTFVMDQPAVLTTTSVLATVNPTFDPTTLGPRPTVNAVGAASSDSFWDNKGAVAGVFTASGLVVLALMVAVGLYIRRYYARKREDDWLNNYQDVGSSASSPRPQSSPVPSMSEVNPFPPTTMYPQPIVGRDLYTDYPPGTQYAPYVPPDVVYGTAITHDGVNSGNQYAAAYGGNHQPNHSYAPTVSSEPSTYSSASSQHHPYAAPIVTVTPAPNPPPSFQVNSQRPLSYDSFYTGHPSPRP